MQNAKRINAKKRNKHIVQNAKETQNTKAQNTERGDAKENTKRGTQKRRREKVETLKRGT